MALGALRQSQNSCVAWPCKRALSGPCCYSLVTRDHPASTGDTAYSTAWRVWESAAESEFCCVTWVWERVLGAWRPEAESEFLRGVALQKGAERPSQHRRHCVFHGLAGLGKRGRVRILLRDMGLGKGAWRLAP